MEQLAYTVRDAEETYLVPYWSAGFFHIDPSGELMVSPRREAGATASLAALVRELRASHHGPLLLRFPEILETRLGELHQAFTGAMTKYHYQGGYQGVYPVKVNQHREVVETIAEAGRRYSFGLEAGSRAELALVLAQELDPAALITTNGFKDEEFIRLALLAQGMGRNLVLTLEKFAELEAVLKIAAELGVKPQLGLRYKLHARGSGQWAASGGERAKFGLSTPEILRVIDILGPLGMLDSLVMLHTHIGSQITDIRRIKSAVREAAQTYVQLRKLGAQMNYLNLGGGLAVDYDGSQTVFYASANYTLSEYAEDLVYVVAEVTKAGGEPHPTLVTESGRALTAYHTVHVVPVIDVIRVPGEHPVQVPAGAHPLVGDLAEGESRLSLKNYSETYHDAIEDRETLETLYNLGLVSLHDRALAEEIFYRIARRIQSLIKELGYVPDEFESLPVLLADQLVGNFSVFHSLPDAWAIDQLFPIVPLAGLNRRPNRETILVDISCDSDGKISHYIDLRDVRSTLPLPPQRAGEPLELGIFLTGAYQEALASEHNLFGAIAEISLRLGQGSEPQWLPKDPAARLLRRVGYRELTPWLPDPQHPLAPAFREAHRRLVEGTTYLGD